MKNIFIRSPDQYTRDLDIVDKANNLAALYLSKKTGKPIKQCLDFISKETSVGGKFELKPRQLKVLKRQDNGDRAPALIGIDDFIAEIKSTKSILSPNLVMYDHPSIRVSCTGKYIDGKSVLRDAVKHMGFEAKQNGDLSTANYCSNEEYAIKILNNSASGARSSFHNPLCFKTAHSALTSTCRILTSYSNASTERFISGNRHYYSKQITINTLLSVIANTDMVAIKAITEKYTLHDPTVDEIMVMIKRSTDFYWRDSKGLAEIRELVATFNIYERIAVMYVGDFYHLAMCNEELVRDFIAFSIERPIHDTVDDHSSMIKNAGPGIKTLVSVFCSDFLSGTTLEKCKNEMPEKYMIYANTVYHIESTIRGYGDLLATLFSSDNAPASIYEFPSSIRRTVVGSDTDSTMFTVQRWIEWYYGKLVFTSEADKIGALLCYLTTQVTSHWLAAASKQLGVIDSNLYRLEMKNEFSFMCYLRANIVKHYGTATTAREGNMYLHPEIDVKGVRLKDSKIPKKIMGRLLDEFSNIMASIMAGNGVDCHPLMQRIANLEHLINDSLLCGKIEYLSVTSVGPAAAYKLPMSSNYMHYDLWTNVFQQKFGTIEDPPYRAVKVKTKLQNASLVRQWLETLDPELKGSLMTWMINTNRSDFTMLLLPLELFEQGLPKEFISVINRRDIVSELMSGYYILLEMLGVYIKNAKNTNLLMDSLLYREEYGLPGDKK